MPLGGRIGSRYAKISSATSASQKSGTEYTSSRMRPNQRSRRPPGRSVCSTATTMPSAKLNTIESPTSSRVRGSASAMTSRTGRRKENDQPSSPRAALPSQRRYCSPSGRSRPNASRHCCRTASVTPGLSRATEIGSPGAKWTRRKVIVVTRKTTITACARRPAKNRRTRLRCGRGAETDAVARRTLRSRDPPVGHPRPVLVGAKAGRVDAFVNAGNRRGLVQPDARCVLDDDLECAARVRACTSRVEGERRAVEQRIDGGVHVRGIVQAVLPECRAAPRLPHAGHVGIGGEGDQHGLEGTALK